MRQRYTLSRDRLLVHAVERGWTACGLALMYAPEPREVKDGVSCKGCLLVLNERRLPREKESRLPLDIDDAQLVSSAALAWVNAAVRDERAHADLSHARPDDITGARRLLQIAREATEQRRQAQQNLLRLLHHGCEGATVAEQCISDSLEFVG